MSEATPGDGAAVNFEARQQAIIDAARERQISYDHAAVWIGYPEMVGTAPAGFIDPSRATATAEVKPGRRRLRVVAGILAALAVAFYLVGALILVTNQWVFDRFGGYTPEGLFQFPRANGFPDDAIGLASIIVAIPGPILVWVVGLFYLLTRTRLGAAGIFWWMVAAIAVVVGIAVFGPIVVLVTLFSYGLGAIVGTILLALIIGGIVTDARALRKATEPPLIAARKNLP